MRAQLKSIDSADIVDFDTYHPADNRCFTFPIEMVIGYEGFDGGDLFQMTVCTPEWIALENWQDIAIAGTALLIVFEYDWPAIQSRIENLVSDHIADDWPKLAQKLSRFAEWQFADYTPYKHAN